MPHCNNLNRSCYRAHRVVCICKKSTWTGIHNHNHHHCHSTTDTTSFCCHNFFDFLSGENPSLEPQPIPGGYNAPSSPPTRSIEAGFRRAHMIIISAQFSGERVPCEFHMVCILIFIKECFSPHLCCNCSLWHHMNIWPFSYSPLCSDLFFGKTLFGSIL